MPEFARSLRAEAVRADERRPEGQGVSTLFRESGLLEKSTNEGINFFPFGYAMSILTGSCRPVEKVAQFAFFQLRGIVKSHSKSILQLWYGKLPIRKKYIRALRKGTLVWEDGQVKLPPIAMTGYDERRNPYRGNLSQLRSPRIWFRD